MVRLKAILSKSQQRKFKAVNMKSQLAFLPGDLRLSDIPENVRPADHTLQDLLSHAPHKLRDLIVSQQKRAKIFSNTLEHDTSRKNLQFKISADTEPQHTESSFRQQNHDYQEEAYFCITPTPK